jgi:hypothetical protein
MQIIRVALVALFAGGVTYTMAYAFPDPVRLQLMAESSDKLLVPIQAKQKNTSKKKGHNYNSGPNSSLGYIPGYVPTPYGRGDCIGWWEPLGNGLMRCHGQFIPYRY